MDSFIPILIVTVLLLLNGLFVAAEFAIIGVPRAAIEHRAAKGDRTARLVRQILNDPVRQDRFIATAQLGITFASLGLGMYGEHMLAEWIYHRLESLHAPSWLGAHALASTLALAILTYFHIVIGEMVPKSLALQQAERTALWITPPMLWMKTLLFPLVVGLNGLGNGVLRLLGIDRQAGHSTSFHTPEELEFVVRESQEGGLLRGESGDIVRELFEFGNLTAGEAMVPRVKVTGVPAGASPAEIETIVRAARHTRYPIFRGDLDHITGAVHVKDLLRQLLTGQPLEAETARAVPYVPETMPLDEVLGVMRRERSQIVVVMDEHGGTAGLLTIEDLFEEVVGEIDEDASAQPDVFTDAEGRVHAMGTARVEEVGEHLGVALEHEEVDTVSGLVLALLNRPAALGDVVEYDQVRFEVVRLDGHGVEECLVGVGAEGSGEEEE